MQPHRKNILPPAWGCVLLSGILSLCLPAGAADTAPVLTLNQPLERQVFQRRADDTGQVLVAGLLPSEAEAVEARAVLEGAGRRGGASEWTVLVDAKTARSAKADKFQGALRLPAGGWYRVDVCAKKGGQVLAQGTVGKVGVGDVFVTAGQSNSANFGQARQAAQDDRVVYFDGKSYLPAKDPIPGGFGGGGTPWALLGDLLAKQGSVPICFRSSTLTYTPVSLWLPDAKHPQYPTLLARVKQFGPHGVRAVLWHQGESDALAKTTAPQYCERLTQVIQSLRKDIGYDVDWFVAQASFHPGATKEFQEPVAAGQKLLWQSKVAFPGPVTDDLLGKEYRSDGVHFTVKGLQVHAQRWLEAITRQYRK